MTFTVFYCTFLLILSVCLSLCVCVWAMLPDSNKMIMMIIYRLDILPIARSAVSGH